MRQKIISLPAKLILVVLFALVCIPLHAQYENGTMVSTIRDSTGAPIPKAVVKITNVATAITSQTTTNDSGDYEVPPLRTGVYTVSASAPGFADAVAQNITI